MLKKVFSYIFTLFILLSFTGCSGSDKEYISAEELSIQTSNDIMAALQNGDAETFKSYLCTKIHDTHPDLDDEIREFFDFIDGEIISYDDPRPAAAGGATTLKEGWVEQYVTPHIKILKPAVVRHITFTILST